MVSFIQDKLQASLDNIAPFIKLSTTRNFYCTCLEQLNPEYVTVNTTRLKEIILFMNEKLGAFSNNKEVCIS